MGLLNFVVIQNVNAIMKSTQLVLGKILEKVALQRGKTKQKYSVLRYGRKCLDKQR